MVPADSRAVSRASRYSGTNQDQPQPFTYGTITHYGAPFQNASTRPGYRPQTVGPTTPTPTRSAGLGSSQFVRHYYGNRFFFLFLWVLRCFSSPGSPRKPMNSALRYQRITLVGSPIRTPPDQSLLTNSPRLIAGSHVLHRFDCQGIHRTPLTT